MQIVERCGFKTMIIMFLSNLGYAYENMKEYRKSNEFYEKSLRISMNIGSRYNIALSFHNLASNYQELEEYATAKKYYEAALPIY